MGEIPETRYAKTDTGAYVAFQVLGDGPTDLVFMAEGSSNVEFAWEIPAYDRVFRRLATFGRLIRFDACVTHRVEVAVATYVLIHGTGSGGWLWDPVAGLLRGAGHEVQAPTLIGVGERASEGGPDTNLTTHVQQVVSLIQGLSVPRVILVGFSYSGLVVEGVAATIPDRIAQLVLIDALLVPQGQCGFDALPAGAAERLRAVARDQGEGWKLPPMPLELVGGIGTVESGVSFADVERTLLERRGTHPIRSYEEPVTWDAALLADASRRYVICTDKPSPLGERLVARVRELRDSGCSVEDLPTGHFPMRTMPKALTAVLLSSAPSTPSDDD